MSSDPTPRAALPLMGRTTMRPTVSGGMPTLSSTGPRAWAARSRAPEARSMATTVSSVTRAGRIRRRISSPLAAPWSRASYTSTFLAMP